MFGHDRFGQDEDYFATYRSLGGRTLSHDNVLHIVRATCIGILRDYELPERFDDFPTVAEALRNYGGASEDDLPILERVVAAHELGDVPSPHADVLCQLAQSHHLGIVSNICSRPEPWLAVFRPTGLLPLFTTIAFSSEGRSIKPSRLFFERVLAALPAAAAVLFVGDSLDRDVIPAKAMGLSTAWIAPGGCSHPAADIVVASLLDLGQVAG